MATNLEKSQTKSSASLQSEENTEKHASYARPAIIGLAASAALFWSGLLGYSKSSANYLPVKPTKNSIFIGDTSIGSEFIVPQTEASEFICGKALIRLQRDRYFKKTIDVLPGDDDVHIVCEGTSAATPFEWPKDAQPLFSEDDPTPA